jgi:hypothetical protein
MKNMNSYPFRHGLIIKAARLACIALTLAAGSGALAQNASLQADYAAYYPGEDIRVQFQGGPGNPKDWVGIYPEEVVPGSVGSTLWAYVNNSHTSGLAIKEGSVTFAGGLSLAGNWSVYLLLNDGHEMLATNSFTVIDPSAPVVRPSQLTYSPGQLIQISFTNGPGNPKDWVGVYQEGQTPGGPASTLWNYVDGTQIGATGQSAGAVAFDTGLASPGKYVAYLLENDGYSILASNVFNVVLAASDKPKLLSFQPSNNSSNLPAIVNISYAITNGASKVALHSVVLTIDGAAVVPAVAQQAELVSIGYTNTSLFPPDSSHVAQLVFADDSAPPRRYTNDISFHIAPYRNIVLPQPIYLESFDATPEGQLPEGWTQKSYTDALNPEVDFGDLNSAAYAQWTVVNADRFKGSFVTYSDPARPASEQKDYRRVLTANLMNVVNSQVVTGPLATGRFLFSNSGYRSGVSQVMFAFTKDFDLTGKKGLYVSYHSLWEQNQDSIAAVEYSVDRGAHWLPIVYMIDRADVMTVTSETTGEVSVDAVATFSAEHGDVAVYTDENGETKGGTYGAFIGASISEDLAPFISPRIDDNPSESKRVELFRLPAADNQAAVRFRFAHAGTDSWYFGVDDFGLYSIPSSPGDRPSLSILKTDRGWIISWPASYTGFKLESAAAVTATDWKEVAGVQNNSLVINPVGTQYYRLRK